MATKTRKAPVVEEIEDEDVDLDELEEDEETETKPKASKGKVEEVAFGASDLAALLTKKTGKTINAKNLRTLLRKMAREDNPRIDREIIAGNKARYSWSGPDDPEVKKIIKAVMSGELADAQKAALDKLKANKAAKDAAAGKGAAKGKVSTKKKSAPVVEDDDEDVEDFEDDDE